MNIAHHQATTIDPSIPQKLAADPRVSSWVSASAGTGKTKVLTDRLLNLMLIGTDPSKILCLTFTKAAAAEMQARLFDKLRHWILLDDAELTYVLTELTHQPCTTDRLLQARSLFTQILDLPGGMKILTIHSFCQNILSRFPLEAAIPPHFAILDETMAEQYLRQATKAIFGSSENHNDQDSTKILDWGITHYFKDTTFQDALEELLAQRHQLRALMQAFPSLSSYQRQLQSEFNFPPEINLLDQHADHHLLENACRDLSFDKIGLMHLLREDPEPDSPNNQLLARWLEGTVADRCMMLDEYARLFLTKDGALLKKPKINHAAEGERLMQLTQRRNSLETAQKTLTLYAFGHQIFEEYQRIKTTEGMLDYDDLIEKTIHLLNQPDTASWVLYKLDGGIDHILIDEAQDTNPHQWQVVLSLSHDFFRPDKAHRTLFVVGDAKQSIYSFQGANPQDFVRLRDHFSHMSTSMGQTWRNVDLNISFRSTPQVLCLVDQVFADQARQQQVLSPQKMIHLPFREHHEGHVSLWPLVLKEEESDTMSPWSLPIQQITQHSPQQELARRLAEQIDVLLKDRSPLPSTGQRIQPRDILILLKQRSALVNDIIRELKKRHIPVAGADRFCLTDHLAVQDLVILGEFLVQPLDDLALATVLRSPFIQMSESDLEDLCHDRDNSLWLTLVHQADKREAYGAAYQWLKKIMSQQDYLSPYELYTYILTNLDGKRKLLARLSLEAEDAINEFLNQTLLFERQNQISLQAFLGYLKNNNIDIKRDSADQQFNQIRIMTIHGSKGLQAPIVIIPERVDGRDRINKLLWDLGTGNQVNLMLIRPSIAGDSELTQQLKEQQSQRDDAEDKRLLYVALTRAQDHLYLCGYGNKNPDDSWYSVVLGELGETTPWETVGELPPELGHTYGTGVEEATIPTYLHESVTLALKKQATSDMPTLSTATTEAAQRGIVIHKLLEDLPPIPEGLRREKATAVLRSLGLSAADLQAPQWQRCIDTALTILNNFEIAPFFGPDSIAELELSCTDGKLIRLDRVVLGRSETDPIKILDYKSTEAPPATAASTPLNIKEQLSTYRQALKCVYPHRCIECYVLWTSVGRLDLVELG